MGKTCRADKKQGHSLLTLFLRNTLVSIALYLSSDKGPQKLGTAPWTILMTGRMTAVMSPACAITSGLALPSLQHK